MERIFKILYEMVLIKSKNKREFDEDLGISHIENDGSVYGSNGYLVGVIC